jgi:ATP-dependent Lon protease
MQTIPIFPLNIVVLPGEPVPLHIFEPRYKQLIADCAPLRGEKQYQPFGITYSNKNKLNEIGCTVLVDEILHKYPEGGLDIMTYGQRRYRLLDTLREQPYLTGLIEWVDEPEEKLEAENREAVLDLYNQFLSVVEVQDSTLDTRTSQLSYEIAYRINLEKVPKLELLETSGENARLKLLLSYLEEAVPEIEQAKEFRRIVRSNGYFA